MLAFSSKKAPEIDKLRGGYYTPRAVSKFVADWSRVAGPRLLEPSCGDGEILAHLGTGQSDAIGVELIAAEADKAAARSDAQVIRSDFFSWFTPAMHGSFDGVAGNPPYIRFGSWDEEYREPAFALMRKEGLNPSRLTNAWVPFVVASIVATRPGGRIALVVPAELLQVGYAAPLRSYLVDNCIDVTVVSFERLLFPGVLQEVVLLLATKGNGPATMRTVEVRDAEALASLRLNTAATRATLHESEKWTKYYLGPDAIELVRRVRTDGSLAPMSKYAMTNVGVVTGRNAFFCMTADQALSRGISSHTIPLVARSNQIKGVVFTASDLKDQEAGTANTRLLAVPAAYDLPTDVRLAEYVALGEENGVHTGYKCRIRNAWWSVPSISVPDGFMLRQVSTHLRVVENRAGATSTDTVHRVFVKPGVSMDKLAVAAMNSATFAMTEVLGRSYGGGILELEPSECQSLPIPDPAVVPDSLVGQIDELVRAGLIDDALDIVDQEVLVRLGGFTQQDVAELRQIWRTLQGRRLNRGSRTTKPASEDLKRKSVYPSEQSLDLAS